VADANKSSYGTLAGLFGRQSSDKEIDSVSSAKYNEQRQVFVSTCWDDLITALREKLKNGECTFYNYSCKSIFNKYPCKCCR
jgi:hypothetical protein